MENVEGRVVLDVLRHVLTACNLASFSLVDCCQSLLSRRLEVLPPSAIARLSSCSSPAKSAPSLEFACRERTTCRAIICSVNMQELGVEHVLWELCRVEPALPTGMNDVNLDGAGAGEQAADRARLALYAADRVGVVRALLQRLATLPEAIEIGRVTGLTLGQV